MNKKYKIATSNFKVKVFENNLLPVILNNLEVADYFFIKGLSNESYPIKIYRDAGGVWVKLCKIYCIN